MTDMTTLLIDKENCQVAVGRVLRSYDLSKAAKAVCAPGSALGAAVVVTSGSCINNKTRAARSGNQVFWT